jgi:outer membrane biosynthesis protein TonB
MDLKTENVVALAAAAGLAYVCLNKKDETPVSNLFGGKKSRKSRPKRKSAPKRKSKPKRKSAPKRKSRKSRKSAPKRKSKPKRKSRKSKPKRLSSNKTMVQLRKELMAKGLSPFGSKTQLIKRLK